MSDKKLPSFLLSQLQTAKDESSLKILNLRNEARERLRAINNRPSSDFTSDQICELAGVCGLLVELSSHQDIVCYSGTQLAMLDRS